jgi:hypothetical protein
MTERQLRGLEIQIARYRFLQREVTDPLAAGLLHSIVLELEADLKEAERPQADVEQKQANETHQHVNVCLT